MAKRLPLPPRKRRTREHVIADLGVNHVERQVLLCGFSLERVRHDYGVDLLMFTYNSEGETENGEVRLQVKATEHLKLSAKRGVSFRVERSDLQSWLREPMPVILIVYNVGADQAYWLYVQSYFAQKRNFNLRRLPATVTVTFPATQILDPAAVQQIAVFRDRVLEQMEGVIHDED